MISPTSRKQRVECKGSNLAVASSNCWCGRPEWIVGVFEVGWNGSHLGFLKASKSTHRCRPICDIVFFFNFPALGPTTLSASSAESIKQQSNICATVVCLISTARITQKLPKTVYFLQVYNGRLNVHILSRFSFSLYIVSVSDFMSN